MSGNFNLDDYVDVAARIAEFAEKYPEGSLQASMDFLTEPVGWFCVARAYRTADDERPGIGHAFEPVPGKTPYTRDSEAQNAETAAWGRAIVALGFQTKKIASKQEVQARQGSAQTPVPATAGSSRMPETGTPDPHGLQASRGDAVQPGQVIVTFGKYKGKQIKDVPSSYFEWWLKQDGAKNPEILAAVELHLGLTAFPPSAPGGADLDADIPFAMSEF